jgi:hypothetical protein
MKCVYLLINKKDGKLIDEQRRERNNILTALNICIMGCLASEGEKIYL